MATKSILKNITVREPKACKKLILALEHAEGKSSKNVTVSRTVQRVGKDEIKEFFGDI